MTCTDRRAPRLAMALAAGALLAPLAAGAVASAAPEIALRDIREFACPPGQVPDAGFRDVSGSRLEINCLAGYRITSGVTPDRYNPAGAVSRAQMALFVARVAARAGLSLDTSDAGFTDIAALPVQFRDAINGLANAAIVQGKAQATYAPAAPVSRGQFATFLTRLQAQVEPAFPDVDQDYFSDDNATTHEPAINKIAAAGIVQGTSAGTYSPRASVTRLQMAAFLTRYLDGQTEAGTIRGEYARNNQVLIVNHAEPSVQFVNDENNAEDTSDDRTYRVDSLEPGTEYRVTLVEASTVRVGPDGTTRFTDGDGDRLADVGTYTAAIIAINGVPVARTASAPSTATAFPVEGEITVTVDGDQPNESIRPVLYPNGGRSPRLELAADDRPIEIFGLGAVASYVGRMPTRP